MDLKPKYALSEDECHELLRDRQVTLEEPGTLLRDVAALFRALGQCRTEPTHSSTSLDRIFLSSTCVCPRFTGERPRLPMGIDRPPAGQQHLDAVLPEKTVEGFDGLGKH